MTPHERGLLMAVARSVHGHLFNYIQGKNIDRRAVITDVELIKHFIDVIEGDKPNDLATAMPASTAAILPPSVSPPVLPSKAKTP